MLLEKSAHLRRVSHLLSKAQPRISKAAKRRLFRCSNQQASFASPSCFITIPDLFSSSPPADLRGLKLSFSEEIFQGSAFGEGFQRVCRLQATSSTPVLGATPLTLWMPRLSNGSQVVGDQHPLGIPPRHVYFYRTPNNRPRSVLWISQFALQALVLVGYLPVRLMSSGPSSAQNASSEQMLPALPTYALHTHLTRDGSPFVSL